MYLFIFWARDVYRDDISLLLLLVKKFLNTKLFFWLGFSHFQNEKG